MRSVLALKARLQIGPENPGEDYLIGGDSWDPCWQRRLLSLSMQPSRIPHKHRDFHQNIPLVSPRNCESITSTEEQSSREESRKRPSRVLATALTTRRETGGRMSAATKLLLRV
jgi:hypothetical protein